MLKPLVFAAIFGAIPFSATAQPNENQQRPTSRAGGTIDDSVDKFLRIKSAQQTAQKERLKAAGVNFGELRSLLVRFRRASSGGLKGLSPQRHAALEEGLLDEVVLELATLGFRASD